MGFTEKAVIETRPPPDLRLNHNAIVGAPRAEPFRLLWSKDSHYRHLQRPGQRHRPAVVTNEEPAKREHRQKRGKLQTHRVTPLQPGRVGRNARIGKPQDVRIVFSQNMARHFGELLVAPPAHPDTRPRMDANQKLTGSYSPIAEERFSRGKLTPRQSEAAQASIWRLTGGIQQMQPDVRAMRPRQVRGQAIPQQKASAAEAIADPASRPAQPEQKIVTHVHPAGNCPVELLFPYPDDRTYKRNPMPRTGVVLLPSRKMLRP